MNINAFILYFIINLDYSLKEGPNHILNAIQKFSLPDIDLKNIY